MKQSTLPLIRSPFNWTEIKFRLIFSLIGLLVSTTVISQEPSCDCPFQNGTPLPNPDLNGNYLMSDIIRSNGLGTASLSGRCFTIPGNLIIDFHGLTMNPNLFFKNCHFFMPPSSRIIIPSGSSHFFWGCTFNGCPDWLGMLVETGGAINVNDCTFRNAIQAGVTLRDQSTARIGGSVFVDNTIGISVTDPNTDPFTAPNVPSIVGNSFENGNYGVYNNGILRIGLSTAGPNVFGPNILIGVYGERGITEVQNCEFNGCSKGVFTKFSEFVEVNGSTFNICHGGTDDLGSNLRIFGNTMDVLTDGIVFQQGKLETYNIFGNTIKTGGNGIYGHLADAEELNIYDNTIFGDDIDIGINLENIYANIATVYNNTININSISLAPAGIVGHNLNNFAFEGNIVNSNNQNFQVGISLFNTKTCTAKDNQINSSGGTGGIFAVNNESLNLCCNSIGNLDYAGLMMFGLNFPSSIQANSLANMPIGLNYDQFGLSGPQSHKGNLWNGSYSTLGAFHPGTQNIYFSSPYKVHHSNPPNHPGIVVPGMGSWFKVELLNDPSITLDCNSSCGPQRLNNGENPGEEGYNVLVGFANNDYYDLDDAKGLKFQADKYLLKRINENSTLENNPSILSFKNANLGNNLQFYVDAENLLAEIINYNGIEYQSYKNGFQAEISLLNDLFSLDQEIFAEQDSIIIDSLLNVRENVLLSLQSLTFLNESKLENLFLDYDQELSSLISIMDNIVSLDTPEIFEKEVNKYLALAFLNGLESFQIQDWETIEIIANGCIYRHGSSVDIARSLYASYNPEAIFNGCSDGISNREKYLIDNSNDQLVFPNPNQGEINVKINSVKEPQELTISDVEGRIVYQLNNFPITQLLTLELPSQKRGMYFIQIIYKNGDKETSKFLKID